MLSVYIICRFYSICRNKACWKPNRQRLYCSAQGVSHISSSILWVFGICWNSNPSGYDFLQRYCQPYADKILFVFIMVKYYMNDGSDNKACWKPNRQRLYCSAQSVSYISSSILWVFDICWNSNPSGYDFLQSYCQPFADKILFTFIMVK